MIDINKTLARQNLSISGGENLRLIPAPNGGWIVEVDGSIFGIAGNIRGAYSNATAMLDALTEALIPSFRAFSADCDVCDGTGNVSTNAVDRDDNHIEAPCPKCSVKI